MNTNEDAKIAKIQAMYAAFGRRDIQTILDNLTDNVEWDVPTPWNPSSRMTRYSGKNGVALFFTTLEKEMEFQSFDPKEFTAKGDLVVALGTLSAHPRANVHASFDTDWAMAFRFRGDKISAFKEYSDPTSSIEAFSGKSAASMR